jgi:hypothetical protein
MAGRDKKHNDELRKFILLAIKSDIGLRGAVGFDSLIDALAIWQQFPTPHELADNLLALRALGFVVLIDRAALPGRLGGDERKTHIEFIKLTQAGFDEV